MLICAPGIVDSTKAAMADLPEVVKDLIRILHSKQSLKGHISLEKFRSLGRKQLTSLSKSSETSGSFKEPGLGGTGIALAPHD